MKILYFWVERYGTSDVCLSLILDTYPREEITISHNELRIYNHEKDQVIYTRDLLEDEFQEVIERHYKSLVPKSLQYEKSSSFEGGYV